MKRGKRQLRATNDCTASELDNVANSNDVGGLVGQSRNKSPFSIFDGKLLRVPITEGFVMAQFRSVFGFVLLVVLWSPTSHADSRKQGSFVAQKPRTSSNVPFV